MTPEDREEALRRFVPWDHKGVIPDDAELEIRLIAAKHADADADRREREKDEALRPESLLARIVALEARLAAAEADALNIEGRAR